MDISKKYADILNNSDISGLSEELKIQYIKYQYENNENDTLVLCNSLYEATTIYNNLRTYIDNVLLFPMDGKNNTPASHRSLILLKLQPEKVPPHLLQSPSN